MSSIAGESILKPHNQHCQHRQAQVLDQFLMPPPKQFYLQGSEQLKAAVRKGKTLLSLPYPESVKWLNLETGPFVPEQKVISTQGNNHTTQGPPRQQKPSLPPESMAQSSGYHDIRNGRREEAFHQGSVRGVIADVKRSENCNNSFGPSEETRAPSGFGYQDFDQHQEYTSGDYNQEVDDAFNPDLDVQFAEACENRVETDPALDHQQTSHCIVNSFQELTDQPKKRNQFEQEPEPGAVASSSNATAKRKRLNSCSSNSIETVLNSCAGEATDSSTYIPTSKFKDVIGHQGVKLRLKEMLLPLKLSPKLYSTVFRGIRTLPASVLLYGPPGTGKTLLAQAVAGEAKAAFMSIGPSDILSKYVGESEAAVRSIFRRAEHMARRTESKCAVVFFDEIDALGLCRSSASDTSGNSGTKSDTGGADTCSRKVLAELLIQLTRLHSRNGRWIGNGGTTAEFTLKQPYAGEVECHQDHLHSGREFQLNDKGMDGDFDHDDCTEPKQFEAHNDVRVCVLVLAATNRVQEYVLSDVRGFKHLPGFQYPPHLSLHAVVIQH
jgi:hypothetical protein